MHPYPTCDASVVTVTYDFDLKGVATLMRNASAIAPHGPFVIVDNGPPGSLPSGLEERIAPHNSAGVTVVPYQGNRGFGAGCNAGVEAAQATPFILLVNPDAEITVGMVDELLATFASNPRLGIASPQLLDHTGARVETAGTFPTVLGLALGKLRRPAHPRQQQATADGRPVAQGEFRHAVREWRTVRQCHADGRGDLPDARPGPVCLPGRGLHREHGQPRRPPAPPAPA